MNLPGYDAWKTRSDDGYYYEEEPEEYLQFEDMEPVDENDDEFFAGWLDAKLVSPEPCL